MAWSVGTSTTVEYQYLNIYTAGTDSANYGWVAPSPKFKPIDLWARTPQPGEVLDVESIEKRIMGQVEELVQDRLAKMIPLFIDAIRWGRPSENFVGSRCLICGAPREPDTGCDYCGS